MSALPLHTPCTPDEFAEHYKFGKRRVREIVRREGLGLQCGNRRTLEDEDIAKLRILLRTSPCRSTLNRDLPGSDVWRESDWQVEKYDDPR